MIGNPQVFNLAKGVYKGLTFPIEYKHESGTKFRDMIDTGYPYLHLVSDVVIKVLEDNRITGWKTFPITIEDKKGNIINGYNGFSVVGKCGPIDYTKSEIITKRLVPNGPLVDFYKGMHVGLDKWDGSDFFMPGDTAFIITEKVRDLFVSNKFSNMRFENLADKELSK